MRPRSVSLDGSIRYCVTSYLDREEPGSTAMPNIDLGVRPLGNGNLGAEIVSLQAGRATPAEVQALMHILAKHGVVCLRNQEMTPAQYVAFAKLFGEIEPSTRERYWLAEQKEIYVISNVVENGRPLGNPNDGFFWHTDQYYFERPTAYTFLYGIETPPIGADTQFCSTRDLYESLPEGEKERFKTISIVASHSKLNAIRAAEGKPVNEAELDMIPDVVHPLVRTHPLTGAKFLYFSAEHASKPLNMSAEEL